MAWQRRNNKKYGTQNTDDQEALKQPKVIHPGVISALEFQKKNAKRISVFIEEKFAFGLHQDVLLQHSLHSGMSLDEAQIEELLAADALLRAKEAAIIYLGHRARSENEVRTKLRRKGFNEEVIATVIRRLHELSYLDDERFAQNYIRTRFKVKGYGPQRLRTELRRLGIAEPLIAQSLEALLPKEDVAERAVLEAKKRLRRLRLETDIRKKRRKLFDFLLRRGHTTDVAREVIEQLDLENESS